MLVAFTVSLLCCQTIKHRWSLSQRNLHAFLCTLYICVSDILQKKFGLFSWRLVRWMGDGWLLSLKKIAGILISLLDTFSFHSVVYFPTYQQSTLLAVLWCSVHCHKLS